MEGRLIPGAGGGDLHFHAGVPILPPPGIPLFPQNQLMEFLSTVDADLSSTGGGESLEFPFLRSLDPPLDNTFSLTEPATKRLCAPPVPCSNRMLRSELERKRRRSEGDRIRVLEGLMPWENRMDNATTLAEAHKYIKFLEAQVTALQSMPETSPGFSAGVLYPSDAVTAAAVGGLGRLNRQQLVQVMVNSPAVMELMCKTGCCVVSAEQAAAVRRLEMILLTGPDGVAG